MGRASILSNNVQNTKRRGRPPGFDHDQVVAAARDLFWGKGLAATSYDELTAATGLHRPSIHAAFGDKRGLFAAALSRYLRDSAAMLAEALSRPTLAEAISTFFATDLALFITPAGGRGCYALGVAAEAGRDDPELAELERAAWRSLNEAVARRVAQAADDELPAGLDQALTTDVILATHVALAARTRAGEPADRLHERVARFVGLFTREMSDGPARARSRSSRRT